MRCASLVCSVLLFAPWLRGFSAAQSAPVRETIAAAIAAKQTPGAVVWMERGPDHAVWAQGDRARVPSVEVMTTDTIFDAASLTKVVATAPSIMLLLERGLVALDAPVRTYLPEFGPAEITLRHLLTHTSGLPAEIPADPAEPDWRGYEAGIRRAAACRPEPAPGTLFRYSDVNFILLGEIVRRVSGRPLDEFARDEIFRPLRMVDTGFRPASSLLARIAPTERDAAGVLLRGVVHDPTSRRMGGVAGHAGLFTTAADLARYARVMLRGEVDGVRLLRPETLRLMQSTQSPPALAEKRGLGWDIDTRFSRPRGLVFPVGSFGHTGFTGTAIWIDPASDTFFVFLSSRLHPDGQGNVRALYEAVGTAVAHAVGLAPRAKAD